MSSMQTMEAKLQETEGFGEESSGKKKSKFKSIKKFFGKKKRKEMLSSSGSDSLKPCQSASDVTASGSMHTGYDSEDDLEIHSAAMMGSRALSHDSIFIPEAAQEPARPGRVFSQENVSDRIRALQLKLQLNWKFGSSSPFGMPSKRIDDAGMSSEDDGLPRSPPEVCLLQEILNSSNAKFSDSPRHLSSLSLAGTGSEEEEQQVISNPPRPWSTESQLFPRQSAAKMLVPRTSHCGLLSPVDFDIPPEFSTCLDNSAAKHKLLVKPRNQRSSRMRRPPSRNLLECQSDLSYTLEEVEYEAKQLLDELNCEEVHASHEDLLEGIDCATYSQQPEMSKGLQHSLNSQDVNAGELHFTSVLDAPSFENNPEGCQTLQALSHIVPLLSPSELKENGPMLDPALNQKPQSKKECSETLKLSSGILSGLSLSVLNREKNPICDMPSKNDILPDKSTLPQNAVHGTEKDTREDAKTLREDDCKKGTLKRSSLPNSTNLLPKSSFQPTELVYPGNNSSSQASCTVPSPQTDTTSSSADKLKLAQELPMSDQENNHPAASSILTLGQKTGREAGEFSTLRKFSVSAARDRPRTSSLIMKEHSECDNAMSVQELLTKTKNSRNETSKEDMPVISFQDKKRNTNKQTSSSESESGVPGRVLDRDVAGSVPQDLGSKAMLSNTGISLPQQSSVGQSRCEDKKPFQANLRSMSSSLKYRDSSSSQESKETKRFSAEFHLEKEELPSSLPKGEKAEIRKPADVNVSGFLNESPKSKTKSSEECSTKPPLPRKPVLQHFTVTGANASKEKQGKVMKTHEFRKEDKELEKKSSSSEIAEGGSFFSHHGDLERGQQHVALLQSVSKQTSCRVIQLFGGNHQRLGTTFKTKDPKRAYKRAPSPLTATDCARGTENQAMPAWITIAKQKQKIMELEISRGKKPLAHDKADAEKPIKEREIMEERQQADFAPNLSSPFPPTVSSEECKKEKVPDLWEFLPRAGVLSHPSSAQSSTRMEKEDTKPRKEVLSSSPGQPLWMELAKKKSQAWSDMPQMTK